MFFGLLVEGAFELLQLLEEGVVGVNLSKIAMYDASAAFDYFKGPIESYLSVFHEIGDDKGGTSRHTSHTMY